MKALSLSNSDSDTVRLFSESLPTESSDKVDDFRKAIGCIAAQTGETPTIDPDLVPTILINLKHVRSTVSVTNFRLTMQSMEKLVHDEAQLKTIRLLMNDCHSARSGSPARMPSDHASTREVEALSLSNSDSDTVGFSESLPNPIVSQPRVAHQPRSSSPAPGILPGLNPPKKNPPGLDPSPEPNPPGLDLPLPPPARDPCRIVVLMVLMAAAMIFFVSGSVGQWTTLFGFVQNRTVTNIQPGSICGKPPALEDPVFLRDAVQHLRIFADQLPSESHGYVERVLGRVFVNILVPINKRHPSRKELAWNNFVSSMSEVLPTFRAGARRLDQGFVSLSNFVHLTPLRLENVLSLASEDSPDAKDFFQVLFDEVMVLQGHYNEAHVSFSGVLDACRLNSVPDLQDQIMPVMKLLQEVVGMVRKDMDAISSLVSAMISIKHSLVLPVSVEESKAFMQGVFLAFPTLQMMTNSNQQRLLPALLPDVDK